jgi:hypothetical protein
MIFAFVALFILRSIRISGSLRDWPRPPGRFAAGRQTSQDEDENSRREERPDAQLGFISEILKPPLYDKKPTGQAMRLANRIGFVNPRPRNTQKKTGVPPT